MDAVAEQPPPRFVVLGNPLSRRVEQFQAALAEARCTPARVVGWSDWLGGRVRLEEVVRAGDVVRVESPGKDFEVERALLARGAEAEDEEDRSGERYERAGRGMVAAMEFDKGRILWPRQWYLGFRDALQRVEGQLRGCPEHRAMSDGGDIEIMFDKVRCQERLAEGGVAQPEALGAIGSFEELRGRMIEAGWSRAFVKLAHGSSASGVVAYEFNRSGHERATTTVEMAGGGGSALRLYNSRRVRTYRQAREIAVLIDALARHRVLVQRWLPKAGIAGRTFDLRVVVIGGRARHVVARLSRSPMTNLHLLNERSDGEGVRARMGESAWGAAMGECERAMGCFPRSLHGGVDLLIAAGFRRHAVLEVNAFGDQISGTLWNGVSTYRAEIDEFATAPLEVGR